MTGLCYNLLADDDKWLDSKHIDRAIEHINLVQSPYAKVVTGGRLDIARNLADRITTETHATVIWRQRHLQDDGVLKRLHADPFKAADLWWDKFVSPILYWVKARKLVLMIDNESLEADLRPYALATAEILKRGTAHHIPMAYGTFATGNPPNEVFLSQLDPMWGAAGAGLDENVKHVYHPNEYFHTEASKTSGHLFRYQYARQRAQTLGYHNLPVVIGEFGLAITARQGYRTVMNGAEYAGLYLQHYQDWYEVYDVPVCCYAMGGAGDWNSFDVLGDEDFLKRLEAFAKQRQTETPKPPTKPLPSEPPKPEPIPAPAPAPDPYAAILELIALQRESLKMLSAVVDSIQAYVAKQTAAIEKVSDSLPKAA